jgi:hypothetical protein
LRSAPTAPTDTTFATLATEPRPSATELRPVAWAPSPIAVLALAVACAPTPTATVQSPVATELEPHAKRLVFVRIRWRHCALEALVPTFGWTCATAADGVHTATAKTAEANRRPLETRA